MGLAKEYISQFPIVYGNTERNGRVIKRYKCKKDYKKYLFKNLSLAPFSGLLVNRKFVNYDLLSSDIPAWQDDDFCIAVTHNYQPRYIDAVSNINYVSDDAISRSKAKQAQALNELLLKYKDDILVHNGIVHYYIFWQLRLIILQLERSNKAILSVFAKLLRVVVTPFFDQISS